MTLEGRVAVVSGIGAGIGHAACLKLLELGADVIGTDIVEEEALDSAFRAYPRLAYKKVDMADEAQVGELFAFVDEQYGRLDILLNIVGGWRNAALIEDTAFDHWRSIMSLNTDSVFLACRAAVPLMRRNKYGRIVNFSSIAGRQPHVRSTIAYPASKAAVVGMTMYLAGEVALDGITVNAVAASTTLTPRARGNLSQEKIDKIIAKIPVGRLGETSDSVNAILFFISEQSDYITGQTVDVNGGLFMK